MNRSAEWLHQAQADLAQAQLSADAGHHEWAPTRYPDSLPEGAPTDHFGRLQSHDALSHAHSNRGNLSVCRPPQP